MNSSLIRKVAMLAAGMVPFAAWSLGLGEIQVSSKLNQPLTAEIALLYDDVNEPETTEVTLAAPEDFERVGLDASALGIALTFSVQTNAAGRYVIAVTSVEPVTDPFVDFLIEVNWPNGRLLREYVVLLDPPVSAGAAEVSSAAPQPREPAPRAAPSTGTTPATAGRSQPAPVPVSPGPRSTGGSYEVEGGDTLWEIARDYRPSSDITINQMMMALYRLNPDAFFQDNINALKKGAILRLPDEGELSAQSVAQALSSVRTQNQAWESYRQSSSSRTPVVSESAATADYLRPEPAPAPDSESRLELVPPSGSSDDASDTGSGQSGSDAANRAQLAALRDDLARSREDLISTNQENEEMRSRIADLERLIATYERTITLKDADLADLQNQIELTGQAVADLSSAPADDMSAGSGLDEGTMGAVDAGLTESDDAMGEEMAATDDGASLDQELAALDQQTPEPAAETVDEADAEEPETTAPPPATSQGSEPSLVDKAMGLVKNPIVLGSAGLLVLLGVGGLVLARRGKGGDDELGGSSLIDRISAVQEAETSELPVVDTDAAVVDLEAPSLDELQAAASEAPDSPQAHLAYLRALYAAEDKDRFVEASRAMLDGVGGSSHPAWMEVRAMGATLAPESGIFGEVEPAADEDLDMPSVALDEPDLGFEPAVDDDDDGGLDFDLDGVDESEDDLSLDIGDETQPLGDVDSASGLDLDLDEDKPAAALDELDDGDDLDLDFDLDGEGLDLGDEPETTGSLEEDTEFELQAVTEEATAAAASTAAAVDDTAEMDLGTVDDAGDTLAELESADEDLGDLGLDDLDLDSDELFGDEDSVGTKLDLAKAYIDMGDPEGAKGMLEEVMAEGSDSQKEEAQGLLDNLSS